MWIWMVAIGLLAIPPLGLLVWYLHRRWQWWMLNEVRQILRAGNHVKVCQPAPTIVHLWSAGQYLEFEYFHNKEDGRRTFSLAYGGGNYFEFSSLGQPRWRWTCKQGERYVGVAIPRYARRLLEEILDMIEKRIKTSLTHHEVTEIKLRADKVGKLVA